MRNGKRLIAMAMAVVIGTMELPALHAGAEDVAGIVEQTANDGKTVTQDLQQGWVLEDGYWYYYEDGQSVTGWKMVGSTYYYMYEDGRMAADTWIGEYYVNASGAWIEGKRPAKWMKDSNGWWYRNENGSYPVSSWKQIGGAWYYFNAAGYRTTGWQYVSGAWYWLDTDGVMQTGWKYINGAWYYLRPWGGMATGWQQVGRAWYYLKSWGGMATGWQQIDGYWYYLNEGGDMAVGWKKLDDVWYYLNTAGRMVTGKDSINGAVYYFNSWGAMAEVDIANIITNAIKPVGKTLYVWGGGWNAADNGSGETALYEGVWPQWEQYFQNNKNNYSYKPGQTAWQNGNREYRFWGLDCSGYLGWTVYNSITAGKDGNGYVTASTRLAESLAGYGFGNATVCTPNSRFYPGDIVSIKGHCFLCLGQCQDGSVLILHSTPNGGVQMSGTVNGSGSSQASKLAQAFMQQYYPEWWSCFGKEGRQSVSTVNYLNGTKFSWQKGGSVSDGESLQWMTADQVLDYIKANQ